MARYYDRYNDFRVNNSMKPIPGLKIPQISSDKTVIFSLGETRLDKLSNMYYNSPYYGWLIMSANQQYGGLEFNIPDQASIIIPFPFENAIGRYITEVNKYKSLYGG